MDNENKNIFTPSSAASLDRLRERRNTASTGDDTGGEAVSAAQSGPENGQSRIPKILKPEARAAQRAESGEAPNETGPAASDAVRQTVQNGVGGEPTCAPQQTAQSAARRNMPGNIRQASTGGTADDRAETLRNREQSTSGRPCCLSEAELAARCGEGSAQYHAARHCKRTAESRTDWRGQSIARQRAVCGSTASAHTADGCCTIRQIEWQRRKGGGCFRSA